MIAQYDRNIILINFVLLHFFPGGLEKLKNGKKRELLPQNAQKIENFWNQPFLVRARPDSSNGGAAAAEGAEICSSKYFCDC